MRCLVHGGGGTDRTRISNAARRTFRKGARVQHKISNEISRRVLCLSDFICKNAAVVAARAAISRSWSCVSLNSYNGPWARWNTTRSPGEALVITAWTNYDWRVTKMVTPDELSIINTSVPASTPTILAWGAFSPRAKTRGSGTGRKIVAVGTQID